MTEKFYQSGCGYIKKGGAKATKDTNIRHISREIWDKAHKMIFSI